MATVAFEAHTRVLVSQTWRKETIGPMRLWFGHNDRHAFPMEADGFTEPFIRSQNQPLGFTCGGLFCGDEVCFTAACYLQES